MSLISSETLVTGFEVTQPIYFVTSSVLQILERGRSIKKLVTILREFLVIGITVPLLEHKFCLHLCT